jgi:hypothetical protein
VREKVENIAFKIWLSVCFKKPGVHPKVLLLEKFFRLLWHFFCQPLVSLPKLAAGNLLKFSFSDGYYRIIVAAIEQHGRLPNISESLPFKLIATHL